VKAEIILILGGARSGKSRFAQRLASGLGQSVLYVAPLVPQDEEMRRRVELHQKARPSHWRTLEAPNNIARAIREHTNDAEVVILDCLTLLVSNYMQNAPDPEDIDALESVILDELSQLLERKRQKNASLIIVSNEVGMGLVPPYPSGRAYRDLLGKANQFISERADKVYMMIAGLPLELKALSARDEE